MLLAALLVWAPPPVLARTATVPIPAPSTPAEREALTRGRALIADFYALRLERLWGAFTTETKAQWGSLEAFQAFREAGARTYGAERQLMAERTFTDAGVTYYVRSATFEHDPRTVWALVFGFDAVGRVGLFGIAAQGEQVPGRIAFSPGNVKDAP
ncbi:hypothetical protein DAETH_08460 [Deinococcus aetherius]|uniref:DUF4019 domain-containing protein n=1 Tax=Deinococcus aetherius TaxID=200252 RepID=A0ABM8AAU0_9DEIO|nr:hypothetical protein DAETH_08460 [Deinococcus aetherius]